MVNKPEAQGFKSLVFFKKREVGPSSEIPVFIGKKHCPESGSMVIFTGSVSKLELSLAQTYEKHMRSSFHLQQGPAASVTGFYQFLSNDAIHQSSKIFDYKRAHPLNFERQSGGISRQRIKVSFSFFKIRPKLLDHQF